MAEKIKSSTFKIKLQTLTPLHIGSGTELMKGADFFYETGKKQIGKVNPKKLYPKYIDNIDDWSAAIMDGEDIYREYLSQRKVPLEEVCDEILPVRHIHGKELKEFIRNGMTKNPVIPGSSIKGAIRTALLSQTILNNEEFKDAFKKKFNQFKTNVEVIEKKKFINNKHKNKELKKAFGNFVKGIEKTFHNFFDKISDSKGYNPQNDIFKYIQVSDAEGKSSQLTVDIFQTLNVNRNDEWYIETSLTQMVEVFEGEVELSIRINEKFWENNKFNVRNIEKLLGAVHNHNKTLLEEQLRCFKDKSFQDANVGEKIIDQIDNILQNINENEYLLRMSAGSGWDFMTGAWLKKVADKDQWEQIKEFLVRNRKYLDYPFPKTRRLTSEYQLPGFVKLSLV